LRRPQRGVVAAFTRCANSLTVRARCLAPSTSILRNITVRGSSLAFRDGTLNHGHGTKNRHLFPSPSVSVLVILPAAFLPRLSRRDVIAEYFSNAALIDFTC